MAQKVRIEIVDDIDGSLASHTVLFGLDGVNYEIDLSDDHAAGLREELERYVAAGRKTGGRKMRVATGQGSASVLENRERSRTIRQWAVDNGYEVSERGRIPADVVADYEREEAEPYIPKNRRSPRTKVAATKK